MTMKLVWLVICLAAASLGLAHAFAPSQAFLQTPPASAGRYMRYGRPSARLQESQPHLHLAKIGSDLPMD